MDCTNSKATIITVKDKKREIVVWAAPCKMWSCPECSGRNREKWTYIALYGAVQLDKQGEPLRFITITQRPKVTPNQSVYFMKKNWPKLRNRAAYHTRKSGINWAYLMVPERHKSGVWHMHIIASTNLARKFWKDAAFASGFGYIADSQPLKNPVGAAKYVTKYIAKGLSAANWPTDLRRVRKSQNWPAPPDDRPKSDERHLAFTSDDELTLEIMAFENMGYRVKDVRDKTD